MALLQTQWTNAWAILSLGGRVDEDGRHLRAGLPNLWRSNHLAGCGSISGTIPVRLSLA